MDPRTLFFRLAAAALLAGLTVPASAQSSCTVGSGVNTLVRAEGYNDLIGDIVLTCVGGVSTAQNVIVPQVDILVTLNGTITSRITATLTGGTGASMSEALLLMDEPNSSKWNNSIPHPIRNCGLHGEDSSTSGPGVCSIVSDGSASDTYDGDTAHKGTAVCASATTYGCGRPNVFQGRQASALVGSVANTVQFLGIPYDPPSATACLGGCVRTLRIVNLRVNGNGYGVASPFSTVPVVATISISNNSSISLTNTSVQVGEVEQGLVSRNTTASFLQCQSGGFANIRVLENFATAFKVKNVRQLLDNGVLAATNYTYAGTTLYNQDYDQDVPGAVYGTETGFYYPSTGSSAGPANPPQGFGTPVLGGNVGSRFANGGTNTGISTAGFANQGTRIAVTWNPLPSGAQLTFPALVPLRNQANGAQTGVLQLVTTDANGANISLGYLPADPTVAPPFNFAVYEVLFSDPNAQEYADIAPFVSYASTTPASTISVGASFAPFYVASATGANLPSASFAEPRFAPSGANTPLATISSCQCDLLFPWVVAGSGYNTSIVVDNTSSDPFGTATATGTVTFNLYGTNGVSTNPANTGTFAAQTTTVPIPPGSYAVAVFNTAGGTGAPGITSISGPFAGYVITQANFQYCHGIASIGGNGLQPQTYVGLEMDNPLSPSRTGQANEVLSH